MAYRGAVSSSRTKSTCCIAASPEQPQERGRPRGGDRDWRLPSAGRRAGTGAADGARAHGSASPQNPLTARVMVNRIWQDHFGAGLVETPKRFRPQWRDSPRTPSCSTGWRTEFIRTGWSHQAPAPADRARAAWRQSREARRASPPRKDGADIACCGVFPPRRLEAEAIRDCMLAVSGRSI